MVEALLLFSHINVAPILITNVAALITAHLHLESEVIRFCEEPVKEVPILVNIAGEALPSSVASPKKKLSGLALFKSKAQASIKVNRFADAFASAGADERRRSNEIRLGPRNVRGLVKLVEAEAILIRDGIGFPPMYRMLTTALTQLSSVEAVHDALLRSGMTATLLSLLSREIDHGSCDDAIVQALQWMLTSQLGLEAMVSDEEALSTLWGVLKRTESLQSQLNLLRVLTVLAGFWNGYPQVPRFFRQRFTEVQRFIDDSTLPAPLLSQAVKLLLRIQMPVDEAHAALPALVSALMKKPPHKRHIVENILTFIRNALKTEPPPPREVVDLVLSAWVEIGFDPKTPLFTSGPAVTFLEDEVHRSVEDARAMVEKHNILSFCESYCEGLLPQGLLHVKTREVSEQKAGEKVEESLPGEIPSPGPANDPMSPKRAKFVEPRPVTPAELRVAEAESSRGMGAVQLQARLFGLLEAFVSDKDPQVI